MEVFIQELAGLFFRKLHSLLAQDLMSNTWQLVIMNMKAVPKNMYVP